MNNLVSSLSVEILKARRTKVLLITIIAFSVAPIMTGFLMLIKMHPELASHLGLLEMKANLFALKADWPSYFNMLYQIISTVGIILFGFITSWVFGREYADRTIKDILALPISRTSIVISKFIVVLLWCLLISIIIFLIGVLVGMALRLPNLSSAVFFEAIRIYFVTALLTILLCPLVGFFASSGRGYLLPLGFVVLTIVLAQFISILGIGEYFPWAIPAIYSGSAGAEETQLSFFSLLIILFSTVIGLVGTILWWKYADQK